MQIPRPEPSVCGYNDKTASVIDVSVVIPVFNGGSAFINCLESLLSCTPGPREIIVVADSESDGSWRYALGKEIRTLLLAKQGGPALARNEGARVARGEILLFLDADVIVKPDIIYRLTEFFAQNPLCSAVIGSYDDCPTEPDIVSQYKNLQHHFVHQHSLEEARTFWGACGAIRRMDFLAVGGFDRHYRTASIEDIELGYRLVKGGYRIKLVKDLQITHQKKWGLFNMIKTDIYKRALPWSALLLKNSHLPDDLNLSFSARVSFLAASLLFLSPLLWLFSVSTILLSLACSGVLLALNHTFYLFLARKRGVPFLVGVLPLHWLYFVYSGFSFVAVLFKEKALAPWSKIRPSLWSSR